MKGRIFIAVIFIFLTSCEKGETDDTILKFFSKAYKDTGNGVAITRDEQGNDLYYYICGQFTDTLSYNANLRAGVLKAGLDGNMIGSSGILGETEGSAAKIIALDNGDVVCTGYILDSISYDKDLFVWHLTSDLTTVNMEIYDSDDNQYGVDILETTEGFLVLATTDAKREPSGEVIGNPEGKKDILLMRIDSDLKPLAVIPAQGYNGDDEGVAVKEDRHGGYIIVGTTDRSDLSSGQSGTNIIILRLNSDGSTTEPRIIGKTGNETASDFEVLSDGYLIAGTKVNESNIQQGYIWKMPFDIYSDPDFEDYIDLVSQNTSSTPCSIKAMCKYKSNLFLLAGQYGTGLSARQLVFAVDTYGTPAAGCEKITGGTGTQIANDVVSGESDYIIIVGSNSYEDNSMISFLKFRF